MTSWKIDTVHSTISFLVRHMLVSRVHGTFNRWEGRFVFDEADPAAGFATARIEADSVDTNDATRDAHLRSSDFLDVGRFPTIGFRSTRVSALEPSEPGPDPGPDSGRQRKLQLAGALTIRGVTREVLLDVELGGRMRDPEGIVRIGFSARTTIQRRAFGIVFNQMLDAGGLALGDKLDITIEIEAVQEAEQEAQPRRHVAG
jgi:polyisoprenoid-binding protein YceI